MSRLVDPETTSNYETNNSLSNMESLPPEILRQIIMSMSYDDIMSYCATSTLANTLCKDDLFWLVKLDHELQIVNKNGTIFRPSDVIRKYEHPDINGLDIYKRWNTYNIGINKVGFNVKFCIEHKYNDIAVWILSRAYGNVEDHCIFIANISSEVGNIEILQLLDMKEIFRYMPRSIRNHGYREYMTRLSGIKTTYKNNIDNANRAAKYGRLDILRALERKNTLPDVIGANSAAAFGYMDILQWLEERGIFPDRLGLKSAIQYGYLDVVIWFNERGFPINNDVVYYAAEYGHLNILLWLEGIGILPDIFSLYTADTNNYPTISQWIEQHGIYPTVRFMNDVAAEDYWVHILNWSAGRGILPDIQGANRAAGANRLTTLHWLSTKGILPNTDGANQAVYNNHMEILDWLALRGILPNTDGADYAASTNHLDMLFWLEHKEIFPTIDGANEAASNGHIDILIWLKKRGILPNNDGAIKAYQNDHQNVVDWLARNGIMISNTDYLE